MIVGFTGTRNGINPDQKIKIIEYLTQNDVTEVHHGDCVGADSDFHNICHQLNQSIKIVIHPPIDPKLRAYKHGSMIHQSKSYIIRNKDIVNVCDVLIACPKTHIEELRSGTWATIRYAKKINKPVIIYT